MKKYGANKATEFTKKQVGVVYREAKKGTLKVEKWVMSEMYDLADYYGYDYNGSVEERERAVIRILENVFAGNTEKAQEGIDRYTKNIELMSKKNREKANREYVK